MVGYPWQCSHATPSEAVYLLSTKVWFSSVSADGWSASWSCVSKPPPVHKYRHRRFGPIPVKQGHSTVKIYGAIFTCLVTRAVHIKMSVSLNTDAFINTLRRFIARGGQVKVIRSDNGTNFVGAKRELRRAISQWNSAQISSFLLQKDIDWRFNVPGASHHGGSWERLIRSTRRVLSGIFREQALTDDSLTNLFAEVEAILNSRSLTRSSSDPADFTCLSPNHLLLLRECPSLPPGVFSKEDHYVQCRWCQVQYKSDLFWKRWIREYLPFLQERQMWLFPERNVQMGDVVLVVNPSAPRGSWPLGRVQAVFPDKKVWSEVRKLKPIAPLSYDLSPSWSWSSSATSNWLIALYIVTCVHFFIFVVLHVLFYGIQPFVVVTDQGSVRGQSVEAVCHLFLWSGIFVMLSSRNGYSSD